MKRLFLLFIIYFYSALLLTSCNILEPIFLDSIKFTAHSAATPLGFRWADGAAVFMKNDERYWWRFAHNSRGFNVSVVDADNGKIIVDGINFDTYLQKDMADSLVSFLINNVKDGRMVLLTVGDSPGYVSEEMIDLLKSWGSRKISKVGYRNAWAFIAIKGKYRAEAEEYAETGYVEANFTIYD